MSDHIAAVVTGDVNASSKMTAAETRSLQTLLKRCFKASDTDLPQAELLGYTGFRGDSWQFVVNRPSLALHATLLFRCHLLIEGARAFDRRLHSAAAIGIGRVEYLPDRRSSAGGGTAYEQSGRRLDRIRKRVPGMGLAGTEDLDPYLDSTLGLIDALVRQWTVQRARAVAMALQGLSQVEIASRWRPAVSQQAIHKHLTAAGWPALEVALAWGKTTLEGCILENNP